MHPWQLTALRDPCFMAEETAKAKFGRRLMIPRDIWTVRLTMNIGLE